ncbi:MAG: lysophospholipase [Hyphomicrobiales bacterium]|nr:MAG: lysophospholipase [Hyphomicrobiales bacterium]
MPDTIYETPGNPVPQDAVAGMLAMPDGRRLRYAHFRARARPLRGTVVLLQGRNECIEKYYETIADLSARGFGVATFDLRGQGGSDRLLADVERGHVGDFLHYATDIDPFFRHIVLPDCRGPYYVLAHSTGALAALLAAPLLANRVERMVLSAPLLGLPEGRLAPRNAARVAGLMHAFGLGSAYLDGGPREREPTPFADNVLTSDPARYARNLSIYRWYPELALGGVTATWVRAAFRATALVNDPDFAASLRIPVLIVAAGAEQVVDPAAAERFGRRLRVGGVVTVDGARHELMQEADIYREQFLAAFDAFVPGSAA